MNYKEKVIALLNSQDLSKEQKEKLESIFPELKESKDEQSKNWILEYLYDGLRKSDEQFKDQFKAAIAWLEKQGEQKPVEKHSCSCKYVGCHVNGVKRWCHNYSKEVPYDECNNQCSGYSKQEYLPNKEEYIKQDLIEKVRDWKKCICRWNSNEDYCNDVIEWLEKQGEQKSTADNFESALKHIMEEAIECGDTRNLKADAEMLMRLVQKPAWSEEDEEIYRKCICAMRASACGFPEEEKFVEQVDNWFKFLKDRVQPQPNQEWSEEDEKTIHLACEFIRHHSNRNDSINGIDCPILIERLKSLRPQSHWRPSEGQMIALKCAITTADEKWVCMNTKDLESLYEDLKKLTE